MNKKISPLVLVFKYLEIFYSGKKLNNLNSIFADDLKFEGPFYQFNSAAAYIESLEKAPPKGMKFKILKSYEDATSACIIYQFFKGKITTPMAQLFEIESEKIKTIKLIFDTKVFIEHPKDDITN